MFYSCLEVMVSILLKICKNNSSFTKKFLCVFYYVTFLAKALMQKYSPGPVSKYKLSPHCSTLYHASHSHSHFAQWKPLQSLFFEQKTTKCLLKCHTTLGIDFRFYLLMHHLFNNVAYWLIKKFSKHSIIFYNYALLYIQNIFLFA